MDRNSPPTVNKQTYTRVTIINNSSYAQIIMHNNAAKGVTQFSLRVIIRRLSFIVKERSDL